MKKKILFLFSNFDQREFTGQSGSIWQLITNSVDDFEPHIISNGDTAVLPPPGIRFHLFRSSPFPSAQFLFRFPLLILKSFFINPTLIHVHGLPLIILAYVVSILTRKPLVCSFNEDITLRPTWMQYLIAFCASQSEGVFVSCQYFKEHLIKLGVQHSMISVTPFGLRKEFLSTKIPPPNSPYDFLYIGDARKSRGFDILTAAATQMPNHRFLVLIRWISNSGKDSYEIIQKLPNVTCLEYPYTQKLTELIHSAKVVLLPFRSTSAILPPLTIVECMALSRCVVTTMLPGTIDLMDTPPTLIAVSPGDETAAIAMAKEIIVDENRLNSIGKNAQKKIDSLFSNQYKPFHLLYRKLQSSN